VFLPEDQPDSIKEKSGAYDFINRAMNADPEERWSCDQLLTHHFLSIPPTTAEENTFFEKMHESWDTQKEQKS